MPRKTKRARYGDYCEEINGVLYGSVQLPLGNGKYRRRRKKVASRIEARQWAEEQLSLSRHGTSYGSSSETLQDLAAWYKHHYLIPPIFENGIKVEGVRSWERDRKTLDRICETFGLRRPDSITRHDLQAFAKTRRSEGVKTATINREFALLRAMFRAGREANKLQTVPKFPINMAAEIARDRVMSFDEERRILAACAGRETVSIRGKAVEIDAKREHLAPVVMLAVDTGMRKGEIRKLRWADVDFEQELITVHFWNSKTEKTRKIGMTPRVRAALSELPRESDLVFPGGAFDRAFRTACKRAGVKDLRFHDLRHSATTRMIRAGIPHTEVMKITGHTQIKTFLRYLNLVDTTVQNAAKQLGNFVEGQPTFDASDSVN